MAVKRIRSNSWNHSLSIVQTNRTGLIRGDERAECTCQIKCIQACHHLRTAKRTRTQTHKSKYEYGCTRCWAPRFNQENGLFSCDFTAVTVDPSSAAETRAQRARWGRFVSNFHNNNNENSKSYGTLSTLIETLYSERERQRKRSIQMTKYRNLCGVAHIHTINCDASHPCV